jgi:hypothetical protein
MLATNIVRSILGTEMFVVPELGVQSSNGVVGWLSVGFHEGEGSVLVRCEQDRRGPHH